MNSMSKRDWSIRRVPNVDVEALLPPNIGFAGCCVEVEPKALPPPVNAGARDMNQASANDSHDMLFGTHHHPIQTLSPADQKQSPSALAAAGYSYPIQC